MCDRNSIYTAFICISPLFLFDIHIPYCLSTACPVRQNKTSTVKHLIFPQSWWLFEAVVGGRALMFTLLHCIFKSKHHQVSVNNKPGWNPFLSFHPSTVPWRHIRRTPTLHFSTFCYDTTWNRSELNWDYISWVYTRLAHTIEGVWGLYFLFVNLNTMQLSLLIKTWKRIWHKQA